MAFKLDKRLTDWYVKYNKAYFDNSLPTDVIVGWFDMPKEDSAATCASWKPETVDAHHTLYISSELRQKGLSKVARMHLLHEMAHVKLYPYEHHGKKFDLEMLRLAACGAFNGLW